MDGVDQCVMDQFEVLVVGGQSVVEPERLVVADEAGVRLPEVTRGEDFQLSLSTDVFDAFHLISISYTFMENKKTFAYAKKKRPSLSRP